MRFHCYSCENEFEVKSASVLGIYSAWPIDEPGIEQNGHFSMRWAQKVIPFASFECPQCGLVFFLNYKKAKEAELNLRFEGELDKEEGQK